MMREISFLPIAIEGPFPLDLSSGSMAIPLRDGNRVLVRAVAGEAIFAMLCADPCEACGTVAIAMEESA